MTKNAARLGRAIAIACAVIVGMSTSANIATAQEMVPWSRHDLTIPYAWNGNAHDVREVVLYYSADQGRSWKKAGSALPHVRSFRFLAPNDGEYWFAIRTYNATGTATPPGPLGPEMRVMVDTARPEIESLNATVSGGILTVDLSASDAAGLPPDSVHVYAQAAGQPGWNPILLKESQPSRDGRSRQLTGQWQPTAAGSISIRATIADGAGNRAEQSTVARQVANKPTASPFATTRPAAFGTTDPFALAEATAPREPPFDPQSRLDTPSRQRDQRQEPVATPWPTESQRTQPLLADRRREEDWSIASRDTPFSSASFRGASEDRLNESLGAATRGTGLRSQLPSRLVNSAEFEFDYELEDTGRWGVAKVELWGTDNGGRSWRRFAIDSDRQSPIHVTTPGEGEYGFRLVIESIGGLEATTPRPGDAPEAVVGVDLNSPRVSLTDYRQGDGYFADQLVIQWRADDAHLAERPIDLFYSNRAAGPWIPIATNLANSGRHSWRLQRHLPRSVYLKIEARDDAGNLSQAISPQPLAIDVPTASGSLQGVRAAR